MARVPKAAEIYELAALFAEECLLSDGSLFWPDHQVWTTANIDRLWDAFVENPLYGGDDFISKWAVQLNDQPDDVYRMAAELMAIFYLFPGSRTIRPETKIKNIQDVYGLNPSIGLPDDGRWTLLVSSYEVGGTGETGNRGQDNQTAMYLAFAKYFKQSGVASLAEVAPKFVLDSAMARLEAVRNFRAFASYNIILHLFWPDYYEDVFKNDHKKKMAKNLTDYFGLEELDDIDAAILQARKHMEENGFDVNFSMYDERIREFWDIESKKKGKIRENRQVKETGSLYVADETSVSHVVAEKVPVYEIARQFKERVIEQGKSLLWPTDNLWTDEAIEQFLQDFRSLPVNKESSWLQNYGSHLIDGRQRSARLLADSYAFLMQFPSVDKLTAASKSEDLQTILSWVPDLSPDNDTLSNVLDVFSLGIGSPGQYFSSNVHFQLAFVPGFVSEYRDQGESDLLTAVTTIGPKLKKEYEFEKSVVPAQNIVLHLLDSANFERIASRGDKTKIAEAFGALIDELNFDLDVDLDSQLRSIRQELAGNHFAFAFDFYDSDVQAYWNCENPPPWPPNCKTSPSSIAEVAVTTHLDEAYLREIEDLLKDKKQVIFEGPPGSGKTFVAEKFARYFTGQRIANPAPADDSLSEPRNDQIEIIQFHQSYGYEDFVEGIRPRMDNGQLVYQVEAGIFLNLAQRAADHPDKKYVLIIDEINRGNVSRILGELMLLFEYREDMAATLPYSKQKMQIPPNLYIIGTMNSADRSLSQIDYALRRRFYFVRFMSVENDEAQVLSRWLATTSDNIESNLHVVQMFVHLNKKLSDRLRTDDLQVGHSYFMRPDIHDPAAQHMVWKYAVMPLLREYLYHDRERDEVLATFTLESIRAELAPQPVEPEQSETDDRTEAES